MPIRLFYDQWPQYNRRLIDVVAQMSVGQLELRPDPTRAPVWAIVGHVAGARVVLAMRRDRRAWRRDDTLCRSGRTRLGGRRGQATRRR